MSSYDKLLTRFLSRPKDFTYSELKRLLNSFDFEEVTKGKTSGSRVTFVWNETNTKIKLHKPHHLGDSLATLNDIATFLREKGFIL